MKKKVLAVIAVICALVSAYMYVRYYDAWKRKANAMSSDTLRSEEHEDITWDLITMVDHNSEVTFSVIELPSMGLQFHAK